MSEHNLVTRNDNGDTISDFARRCSCGSGLVDNRVPSEGHIIECHKTGTPLAEIGAGGVLNHLVAEGPIVRVDAPAEPGERWRDRPADKEIRRYTIIVANGDRITLGRGGRISEGGIINEIARDPEGIREQIAAVVKKAAEYENPDACWFSRFSNGEIVEDKDWFSREEIYEDSACWKLRSATWCGETETYGDLREVWVGIKVYYDDGTNGVIDPMSCYPRLAIEFDCDSEKIEQINAMLEPGDSRRRVQVPGDEWLSDAELEMAQTHSPEVGL